MKRPPLTPPSSKKRQRKKPQVDPETLIVESCLQLIMPSGGPKSDLIEAITCTYPKEESPQIISILNTHFPLIEDPISLVHLRRFRKKDDLHVQCIVCSEKKASLESVSSIFAGKQVKLEKVPLYPPVSLADAQQKSRETWPVLWKGDPKVQALQQQTFDVAEIEQNLRKIAEMAKKQQANGEVSLETLKIENLSSLLTSFL